MAQAITDQSFQSFITGSKLALVDFTATWCGPCQMLKPILEKLSTTYTGKVHVGAVDIDENRSTASTYRISSVPTLILFKDGKPVEQVIGVRSERELSKMLDKHLTPA